MDWDEISNLYRAPSIHFLCFLLHFCKFRFIWLSSFGEDFLEIDNQKQELPMAAMFVNGSGRNEQSLERTAHRCFLPSFGSFGQTVSE
jgi:uncharacterized damage-inducible protein DinB